MPGHVLTHKGPDKSCENHNQKGEHNNHKGEHTNQGEHNNQKGEHTGSPLPSHLGVHPDNYNLRCTNYTVGADLRVCPDNTWQTSKTGQSHRIAPTGTKKSGERALGERALGGHIGSPLHTMIQWFKTMTTNEYIRGVKNNDWPLFNKKLWQRNYYDHIIHDEKSYFKIAEYIIDNPLKWHNDKYYE